MSGREIELEAGGWVARLDSANVTEADRSAFDAWCAADDRHAAAYARLAATWKHLDRLQVLGAGAQEVDADLLAGEAAAERAAERAAVAPSRGRAVWWMAAAAGVVVALGAGWWGTMSLRTGVYETSVGGYERVVLRDGSVVDLNTDTEVAVDYSGALRRVELRRGEANFKVAHDVERPFVVTAGGAAVRAVGTQFNVRRREDELEVLVTEGRVAVGTAAVLTRPEAALPASAPIIAAGQQATARREGVERREVPTEIASRRLAWQTGMVAFEQDALADVVAEFNRYNERQIVIADAGLAGLRVGGYFRPTNLDAFVAVLEESFGVDAEVGPATITLRAAPGGGEALVH